MFLSNIYRLLPRFQFAALGLGTMAAAISCGAPDNANDDVGVPSFQGLVPGTANTGNSTEGVVNNAQQTNGATNNVSNNSQVGNSNTSVNENGATSNAGIDANQEQFDSQSNNGAESNAANSDEGQNPNSGAMVQNPASDNQGAGGAGMDPVGSVPETEPIPTEPEPSIAVVNGGCSNSAFFCEDFEAYGAGGLPNNAPWNGQGNGLSIDGTVFRNGAKALHVQTQNNGNAYIQMDFDPPGNSFFGRINVRVEDFPSSPDYAHFTLVEVSGSGNNSLVRPMGGQFMPGRDLPTSNIGLTMWGLGNDLGGSGDWTDWEPSAIAESAQWICYEWQMDENDNTMRAWLNGVAQPNMTVSTLDHNAANGSLRPFEFPQFNAISMGWWFYQGDGASHDVWMDDIVLSTERIGCD